LLQHGEKIGISLVGLIVLFLVYKSTSLPHLDDKFQATKLQDEISQTSAAVRNAEWPAPDSELASEVKIAKAVNEKVDAPIPPDPYKTTGLDPTIVEPSVLRTDPVLINAQDVRATGGSGLFAFIDEQIRKQQDLEMRAKQDELAKKEAERLEKERTNPPTGAEGPGARGRGEEMMVQPFDPDHPKRRPVEGSNIALGVPRQGGERIERAYWACVTAKVPIREQLKLYQDAFEKAKLGYDPTRDFPQYKGYLVQRAEVIPNKPLEWKPVVVYDGQRKSVTQNKPVFPAAPTVVAAPVMDELYKIAQANWAGMAPDVIDQRFFEYVLTMPLPPLVGRDWGAEATHPDIPLIADTPPLEEEIVPLQEATPVPGQPIDAFGAAPGAPQGMMQPGPQMRPGMQGMGQRFNPEMMMGRRGPGMMMGEERGMGGPEGGLRGGGGAMPGTGTVRTSLPKGQDYLLLRFFDFTVEPGKKYKYQVQLVLADPNALIPENMNALAPEVLDRRAKEAVAAKGRPRPVTRRVEGWSDPSPTVGIPLAGSARLVDVKMPAAEKFSDEPSVNLLVESFDVDAKNNSIQTAKQREFRRGNVANFVEDAEYLGDGNPPWIDTKEDFKFVTGLTVIDIEGGKKLTKDYLSPGKVMLMGSAGELYIRNELDDKPAVDYHQFIFEKRKNPMGMEGMGPDGGPGRMQRGGRGGGERN
jgi:hypothetical protein